MTLFAACLRLLGLSHREAAGVLGVRPDTVKSWSAGRNGVPPHVWDELRRLYADRRSWPWPSEGARMAWEAERFFKGPPSL